MKKYKSIFLIILFCLTIILVFIFKPGKNTISSQEKFYKIKDAAKITSIHILKANENIILDKNQHNQWIINNKFFAKQEVINELINLCLKFEIIAQLSEQDKNQHINQFEKNLIEVKILRNNKTLNNFYISSIEVENIKHSVISNKAKNYIYTVKASSYPYAIYSIFNTNINFLRNKILIQFLPYQIKQIKLENNNDHTKSFKLSISKNKKYEITPLNKISTPYLLNQNSIELYLGNFQNIKFEDEIDDTILFDSIAKTTPFIKFKIKNKIDSTTTINIYQKTVKSYFNILGKQVNVDPDYCYIIKNMERVLYKTKYTEIEHVIKDLDYFIIPEKRKD